MHKVADRVVDFTRTLSVYVTRRYLHFLTALIIPKILILQSCEQWSFYHFSGDSDRDVFNEKPSREEMLAATQVRFKNNRCTHVNLQMMLSYDNPLYGHKSVGLLFTWKNASVFYINFNNWSMMNVRMFFLVGCCKLSFYANESCDEHAVYFRWWLKWSAMFITYLLSGNDVIFSNRYPWVSCIYTRVRNQCRSKSSNTI